MAYPRNRVEGSGFPDLRRGLASHLAMGSVHLWKCKTLLGHKDLRMTMRYSHLSPEHLREAVQNLDKSFTLNEGIRKNLAQQSVP